jgi:hypothetical protein
MRHNRNRLRPENGVSSISHAYSIHLPSPAASSPFKTITILLSPHLPRFPVPPLSSTMILCQKPTPFPLSPLVHHRRHPSAPPAVVVHPTCIPGLLSLSKPVRPSPHRQQQQQQQQRQPRSPKPKSAAQRNRSPQAPSSDIAKTSSKPTADKRSQLVTPASSPEKNRGRQQAKPHKDKTARR